MVLYAQQDEAGNLVVGPDKSNMTGRISAMVFTVSAHPVFEPTEGSDGVVPRLDVVGESTFTASEQLAESVRAERDFKKTGGNQETEAGIAIGVALADGEEHESSRIVEDIMKMGYSARTIQRAATAIGVIKRQRGRVNAQAGSCRNQMWIRMSRQTVYRKLPTRILGTRSLTALQLSPILLCQATLCLTKWQSWQSWQSKPPVLSPRKPSAQRAANQPTSTRPSATPTPSARRRTQTQDAVSSDHR